MNELLMLIAMICKTEGSVSHRQLQMQGSCVAYMLEQCPDDLDKNQMLTCVKGMVEKVKNREFER